MPFVVINNSSLGGLFHSLGGLFHSLQMRKYRSVCIAQLG